MENTAEKGQKTEKGAAKMAKRAENEVIKLFTQKGSYCYSRISLQLQTANEFKLEK